MRAAELSRFDYATACVDERRDGRLDVEVAGPQQVSVSMGPAYAEEMLRQLRDAPRPKRGELCEVIVDCPVKITLKAETLESLADRLGVLVGRSGAWSPRRGRPRRRQPA